MKKLVTSIGVFQVLRYDNLFKLRHTQLLIDGDILLTPLSIGDSTNTLSHECQVILVPVANSEVFLYLLQEPSEKLRGPTDDQIINVETHHSNCLSAFARTSVHRINEVFKQLVNKLGSELRKTLDLIRSLLVRTERPRLLLLLLLLPDSRACSPVSDHGLSRQSTSLCGESSRHGKDSP